MRTIWKYSLPEIIDLGSAMVEMPRGARVVHIGMQSGHVTLWAIVDTGADEDVSRSFTCYGTGQQIGRGDYIGTVRDGPYIWHIFEMAP